MTGTYTLAQVAEVQADMEFWQQFEHDNWKLTSFTGRSSAQFGWLLHKAQYEKHVAISFSQIKFFRGVQPDVIDQTGRDNIPTAGTFIGGA